MTSDLQMPETLQLEAWGRENVFKPHFFDRFYCDRKLWWADYETRAGELLQRRGVDVVALADERPAITFEMKIVGPPGEDRTYDAWPNLPVEFIQNRHYNTPGWIRTITSDWLIWGSMRKDGLVDLFRIDVPDLKVYAEKKYGNDPTRLVWTTTSHPTGNLLLPYRQLINREIVRRDWRGLRPLQAWGGAK